MSTHPNVLLIAVFTPEDGSRKTMRAILAEAGCTEDKDSIRLPGGEAVSDAHTGACGKQAKGVCLSCVVMESDYNEGWQISAQEGDLLFFDLVTYGYGEFLSWNELEEKKKALEEWCKGICERHRCSYQIRVSANYW